jgi:hypothetical protein
MVGGLVLLSGWWGMAGSAGAASYPPAYPPALGCEVSGLASPGSGLLHLRGTGFGAGSLVLVGVAGRSTGAIRADTAGSFQTSWPAGTLQAGATVTAADAGCSATSALAIENQQDVSGNSGLPPTTPGPGPTAVQPGPAKRAKHHPPASPTNPEPVPPTRQADPAVAAIPSVPLTGLPPQLFLGLAGAVMLAGVALTGLTGRLGHRSERPPVSETSVASPYPMSPGTS